MILKIAWRNIWRNKRRTYITASAIVFAVFFSSFAFSLQIGSWDYIIDNVVKFHFGYVQIHKNGYFEEQSIDNSIEWNKEFEEKLMKIEGVKGLTPRLESFALAYNFSDTISMPVMMIGTYPDKENKLTGIKSRIIEGNYLNDDDNAIIIAEGLARKLKLKSGDSLTFISQGYHGANAAAIYPIKGIVKFGAPDLNNRMVYLPMKAAQNFFAAENIVSSVVLHLDGKESVNTALNSSNKLLGKNFEAIRWEDMIPGIVQARDLKLIGNTVIMGILYIIISFGILGTILMMTKERQYEFGILTSIGMKRRQLAISIWLETLMLCFLGVILGTLFSFPIVAYFHYNPINMGQSYAETFAEFGLEPVLPTAMNPEIFISQALLVFILSTILTLYPVFKILKLNPIKAMRG